MSDNKAEEIEIIEPAVEEKEVIDLSVLPAEEQKMAKDLGIVPKEETKEVKDESKEAQKKSDDKVAQDKDITFEDVEKNEKKYLGEFTKREQASYFKYKEEKRKRQEAQAERDLTAIKQKTLSDELNKAQAQGNLTLAKLQKIEKLLAESNDDNPVTIEALQEIIASKPEPTGKEESKDKPLTKADLEEMQKEQQKKADEQRKQQEYFITRLNTLDDYGRSNFDNYDDIVAQAKEVIDGKVELPAVIDSKDIAKRLVEKINDKDASEEDVAEFIVGIAKLNPKYGKLSEKSEGGKLTGSDIDKIVKNAEKGKSSASVSSGSSRRVAINDISLEDAAKLSNEQYRKLPIEVRERLKREASIL